MKPTDLDDLAPVEPDTETLARVRARSGSFRRRRNAQRFVSAASGVLVVALAVGIAFARLSSGSSRPAGPTTTTTTPPAVTTAALAGPWSPVSVAGYDGPLTDPPLSWVPRLTFENGTFSGSDGCNDVSGTYQVEAGGSFHVKNHFATLVGCRQKVPLLDVLYATTRVDVSDGRLTLVGADGRELAAFAHAVITARIELPSDTITAGTSAKGTVVVENDTGQPVHASGCVSYFDVLLENDDVHQPPSWLDCLEPFVFPVGESRHPVTVSASYNSCAASRSPTPNPLPGCLSNNDPPPLPAGDYRATLFQSGNAVPAPPPTKVHVVDPNENATRFTAADLERELANAGYRVTPDGTTAGGVLARSTRLLCARGTQVRVMEYPDEAARRAVSDGIDADGFGIVDGNRHTSVDWIGPPHFFARGRVLVLVLQDDAPLLQALTGIMGPTISPNAPPSGRAKAPCT